MGKREAIQEPSVRFARSVDWNLFKTFYVIGRTGGIGAAARSLNKTQPSISIALKRLEDHLGVPLCLRTARGIEMTLEGQGLLELCEQMFGAAQSVQRTSSAARVDVSGTIYLKIISNLYIVPEIRQLFDDFHARHPRIEISLDVGSWRDALDSVRNRDAELAIGFKDDGESGLEFHHLCNQETQIYCGPRHPLFGSNPVGPDALRTEPFVITEDEPLKYVRFRERHGLGKNIGSLADNLHERMWLIHMGMGIGILPKPIVEASTFRSDLWPLLGDPSELVCGLYLITHGDSIRSAPAQLLLQAAREQFQLPIP